MSSEKPNKNYFVLLGGMADFGRTDGDSLLNRQPGETVVWTVKKEAQKGDIVFIYITSPISSIVASGELIEAPWLNENSLSAWEGYWMAEIGRINLLEPEKYVPMKTLRELFPEWSWLRYPRGNTKIPADVLEPFLELVNQL